MCNKYQKKQKQWQSQKEMTRNRKNKNAQKKTLWEIRQNAERRAGFHTTSPRAQTCTFEGPGLQKHHQNSTRRPPEREKERKWGREREKKSDFFGGPAERGSGGGGSSGGGPGVWSCGGGVLWRGVRERDGAAEEIKKKCRKDTNIAQKSKKPSKNHENQKIKKKNQKVRDKK